MNNVVVLHHQEGRLVDRREAHNTWTTYGQEYLARIVSYQVLSPAVDVPQETSRVKYLGLGLGSLSSASSSQVGSLAAAYPAGQDPQATNGRRYRKDDPTSPPIRTLERPVRRTGGLTPYPGDPSDVWLFGPLEVWYRDIHSVTYAVTIDCAGGDMVFPSSVPGIPITEAALLLGSASVHTAYNPVVAYVNFDSILFKSNSVVSFSWSVRFA